MRNLFQALLFVCFLSSTVRSQSGDIGDWIQDLIPPLACLGGDSTPLKCDPGDVLLTTSARSVNQTLDSVLWHDAVSDKKVALGLSLLNNKDLYNPSWYIHEGEISTVPPYELRTSRTLLLLFTKGEFNRGVSGVLSYDVRETDYKVAIMWHISSESEMSFNMKSYPLSYTTNEDLYNHMLESAGPWTPENDWSEFHVREEYGIVMEIVMSPRVRGSEVMARIETRGYDPDLGPHLHLSCEYRDQRGYDDYYCKKECLTPLGECFTEIKCASAEQCRLDYACSSGC